MRDIKTDFKSKRSKLGFIEAVPKPTKEELEKFYSAQYFQKVNDDYSASYNQNYSDEELAYGDIAARLCVATAKKYAFSYERILDIGCGEGFFSKHFYNLKSNVSLTDLGD